MTAVLATGQIGFCLVVIARQLGNSLTPLVGRLTTSDSESLSFFFFFILFCEFVRYQDSILHYCVSLRHCHSQLCGSTAMPYVSFAASKEYT